MFRISFEPKYRTMSKFTKRQFLSYISSIWDPLGLISPIIILCKVLFQRLWLVNIGWDQQLPNDIHEKWMGILHELPQISRITIPRFISLSDTECIELIGFADASQCAYGACVYIRAGSSSKVIVNLLTAKSKVSPLKIISIPRLELCAALLLARLASNVSRN